MDLCYSKCKDNCRFAHGRVPKGVFIQRKNNDSQGEKKEREDSPTVALHNWKSKIIFMLSYFNI